MKPALDIQKIRLYKRLEFKSIEIYNRLDIKSY